jgi:hypothetical protein
MVNNYFLRIKVLINTILGRDNELFQTLTDEEIHQWIFLRSNEWSFWPLFVTQPFAPILFLFMRYELVITIIVILNLLWIFIRHRYYNMWLARVGSNIVVLFKWPFSIVVGIYFLIIGNYLLAGLSMLWPFITLILLRVSIPTGRINFLKITYLVTQVITEARMKNKF